MGDKARDGWEASLTTRRPNATDGKTGKKQKKLRGGGGLTEPKQGRGERGAAPWSGSARAGAGMDTTAATMTNKD